MSAGSRYSPAGISRARFARRLRNMLRAYGAQEIRLHIARFAHIPAGEYRLPALDARGGS
jgi:hypothetical protein